LKRTAAGETAAVFFCSVCYTYLMDFKNPYLTKQVIAYIGNKRKLLPLIYQAISQADLPYRSTVTFLDLFSGSGVVSRFAKFLGYEVFSNDWEPYGALLAEGFINVNQKDFLNEIGSEEQVQVMLSEINTLPDPSYDEQYITRYFSPAEIDVEKADFHRERLFYTRRNGLAIDKIRNYIEKKYPDKKNPVRNVLLSLLVYEAATHTNTSGVFKSFHKGFGGHGKDALSRILGPVMLHRPYLIDSSMPMHVSCEDANEIIKRLPYMDIAYLDPPYNQHQYGSNYHLLNTIVLWDKIPVSLELNKAGELINKAGIRSDWTTTKSAYCYRDRAVSAFSELIQNLNAGLILISYSSDGIIPFEIMKKICMEKGSVSIITGEYTTYRGGRQCNSRQNNDIEFILAINTLQSGTLSDEKKIDLTLLKRKALLLFKKKYNRKELQKNCISFSNRSIDVFLCSRAESILTRNGYELFAPDYLNTLTFQEISVLIELLESCLCKTKSDEIEELIKLISIVPDEKKYYIKRIPALLKKLAYKKSFEEFTVSLNNIKAIEQRDPGTYQLIAAQIEAVCELADLRIGVKQNHGTTASIFQDKIQQ
jgi:adenine-specific DNA-methyltransferase